MVLTGSRRRPEALFGAALVVTLLSAATIGGAWAFQYAGYVPCDLCLLEREPYYASLPIGAATAFLARQGRWRLTALGFGLLTVTFLIGAGFGAYHTGVEWKLWAGPSGCTGPLTAPAGVNDFLKQLNTVKVVRCDAPALMVLGLSLATWNALMSLLLAVIAVFGLRSALRFAAPRA